MSGSRRMARSTVQGYTPGSEDRTVGSGRTRLTSTVVTEEPEKTFFDRDKVIYTLDRLNEVVKAAPIQKTHTSSLSSILANMKSLAQRRITENNINRFYDNFWNEWESFSSEFLSLMKKPDFTHVFDFCRAELNKVEGCLGQIGNKIYQNNFPGEKYDQAISKISIIQNLLEEYEYDNCKFVLQNTKQMYKILQTYQKQFFGDSSKFCFDCCNRIITSIESAMVSSEGILESLNKYEHAHSQLKRFVKKPTFMQSTRAAIKPQKSTPTLTSIKLSTAKPEKPAPELPVYSTPTTQKPQRKSVMHLRRSVTPPNTRHLMKRNNVKTVTRSKDDHQIEKSVREDNAIRHKRNPNPTETRDIQTADDNKPKRSRDAKMDQILDRYRADPNARKSYMNYEYKSKRRDKAPGKPVRKAAKSSSSVDSYNGDDSDSATMTPQDNPQTPASTSSKTNKIMPPPPSHPLMSNDSESVRKNNTDSSSSFSSGDQRKNVDNIIVDQLDSLRTAPERPQ